MTKLNEENEQIPLIKIKLLWSKITVKVSTFAYLLALICIAIFWFAPPYRDLLKYSTGIIAGVTGLISVFYVGFNLKRYTVSLRETRTLTLIERWNAPEFFKIKSVTRRMVLELIKTNPSNSFEKIKEISLRTVDGDMYITDLLNFLEELAIFINKDFVYEELLYDYFCTIVSRYYDVLEPWIVNRRRTGDERLFTELEELYEKWKSRRIV